MHGDAYPHPVRGAASVARWVQSCRYDLDEAPQEAARLLLGPRLEYGGDSTTAAPFNKGLLSLPAIGGSPVEMSSVLDQETADLVRSFEDRMLRSSEEVEGTFKDEQIGMHTYAKVRRSRACYFDLTMLNEMGLLHFTPRRRGRITPFWLQSESGKQRLVLDCRRVNVEFQSAPFTEIAAIEAFNACRSGKIGACCHRRRRGMPPPSGGTAGSVSELVCLPTSSAAEAASFGLLVTQSCVSIDPVVGDLFPCLFVLPMG